MYKPVLTDTSGIEIPPELNSLIENLARHVHDSWAQQRIADGWVWGPSRDDVKKTMPGLVPYEELPESEREYDRITATETIKLILANGFTIGKEK